MTEQLTDGQTSSKVDVTRVTSSLEDEEKILSHTALRRPSIVVKLSVEEQIEFNFPIFLWTFISHALYPFSLPLILIFDTKILSLNQSFLYDCHPHFSRPFAFIVQWLFPILFYSIIFIGIFYDYKVSSLELGFALCASLAHKLVVASKYALMTSEQLENVRTSRLTGVEYGRYELVTGWANPTVETLDEEIRKASKRSGVDLEKVYFYVQQEEDEVVDTANPTSEIHPIAASSSPVVVTEKQPSFLKKVSSLGGKLKTTTQSRKAAKSMQAETEKAQIDAYYESKGSTLLNLESTSDDHTTMAFKKIRAVNLAVKIVREMMIKCDLAKGDMGTSYLCGLIQALLPMIIRACQGDNVFGSYEATDIFLTFASAFMVFFFYGVLLAFFRVGVADYFRRYVILSVLGRMIDPSPVATSNSSIPASMRQPQFIDLTVPHNITSWFALRQVLSDIGAQYRARITLYTSYGLILAISFTLYLIYHIAFGKSGLSLIFIIGITFCVLCVLFPLALMVGNGTRSNHQFDVHTALLMRIRFSIRELISEDGSREIQRKGRGMMYRGSEPQLQACDRLIGSALGILTLEKQVNPIKILGFEASDTLVQAIASVGAGALASGLKLFRGESID